MSEVRLSTSQPQGPAFQPKAQDAPKVAPAPKAPKAPAKVESPKAKVNSAGVMLRCTVKMGASQCANPARWPHGKGLTCSTHHKAIAKGSKVTHLPLKATYQAPSKAKTA